MPRESCSACGHPLPFAARRCRHCGPLNALPTGPGGEKRSARLRGVLAVGVALLLFSVAALHMGGDALSERYTEFALRHLPAGFVAAAPATVPTDAFHACVQRVAREVRNRTTVETFSASGESTTLIGESRYRVRSQVESVDENGGSVIRPFSCTVRFAEGRWTVEEVVVDRSSRLQST